MKTILQVEDDPNDVFFLQRAMKKVEVTNHIQVACDVQEAIDYFQCARKYADRGKFRLPCLVLLDLKLPRVMGLDVLKWIREQAGAAVPVVILTASAEDADIASAYRLGASGFLVKPSEASKLEDMARAIKHFWLTHNTLPESAHGPPKEGFVSPVVSSTNAFAAKPSPSARTNDARREEVAGIMAKRV